MSPSLLGLLWKVSQWLHFMLGPVVCQPLGNFLAQPWQMKVPQCLVSPATVTHSRECQCLQTECLWHLQKTLWQRSDVDGQSKRHPQEVTYFVLQQNAQSKHSEEWHAYWAHSWGTHSIVTAKAKQWALESRRTNYTQSQKAAINRKWGQTINWNPFPPSDSLPPPEFYLFRVPKFSNSTLTWEPSDKHKPHGGHIVYKSPSLMESLKERWLISDKILKRGRVCMSIDSRLFSSVRILSTLCSLSLDTCTCIVSHACISGSTAP